MKAVEVIAAAGCPGFTTDPSGRIIGFNRSAEVAFGCPRSRAIGRKCFDLLRGKDLYGNRFCQEECAIRIMARRGEPISPFSLRISSASGEQLDVSIHIVAQPERGSGSESVAHLVEPRIGFDSGAPRRMSPEWWRHGMNRQENGRSSTDSPGALAFRLTRREIEVLRLLAEGKNCAEISRVLQIAMATARNHIRNILRKLGVHSQAEAISFTYRNGLL